MSRLRDVGISDTAALDNVALLHVELLHFGPMARLGPRFIRDICYASHMSDGTLQVALYEVDGQPAGFVAFTDRSISFHRTSLKRHWVSAGWTLALSLLENPRRLGALPRALRVVLSRRSEIRLGQDPMGEVVCVAVKPTYLKASFVKKSGLRISEELIRYAGGELHAMGVREMRMLVDEDNLPVRLLYHRLGARFEPYEQGGKATVLVWFDLEKLSDSDATRALES